VATSFKFRYSGQVVPTEEVTLSDGSDVSYNINSNLDKVFGSSTIKTIGTTSTKVLYDTYLTTTSPVALSHSTILNEVGVMSFLYIKIVSAGSSGTPDVAGKFYTVDPVVDGYPFSLSGVGDFIIIPLLMSTASVSIYSTGATTVANVEILVGIV